MKTGRKEQTKEDGTFARLLAMFSIEVQSVWQRVPLRTPADGSLRLQLLGPIVFITLRCRGSALFKTLPTATGWHHWFQALPAYIYVAALPCPSLPACLPACLPV